MPAPPHEPPPPAFVAFVKRLAAAAGAAEPQAREILGPPAPDRTAPSGSRSTMELARSLSPRPSSLKTK